MNSNDNEATEDKNDLKAQPQRSEPQDDSPHWAQANEGESETSTQDECVEAIVKWVVADTKAVFPTITSYDDTCLRKEVSFQVNAALTAERQRREQTERAHEQSVKNVENCAAVISDLKQKLLSALAAIEKHNKENALGMAGLAFCHLDVDLSLLHDHVRKEQKPLVDALKQIADGKAQRAIAANALAKVKDKP